MTDHPQRAATRSPLDGSIEHMSIMSATECRPSPRRIGVLVPATDHMTEVSFRDMLVGTPIEFFTNRVAFENPVSAKNLARLTLDLERAMATLVQCIELDAIAFSCTSGTVIGGHEKIVETIARVRPSVPVVTPITAAIQAFRTLRVANVAVLTPYTDEINRAIRDFLEANGLHVVRFGAFSLDREEQIASVPLDAIVEAGRELCRSGHSDGLFISCTGMRGHAAVVPLEELTGRPVITSNQAQIWQLLDELGIDGSTVDFGSIFSAPGPKRLDREEAERRKHHVATGRQDSAQSERG